MNLKLLCVKTNNFMFMFRLYCLLTCDLLDLLNYSFLHIIFLGNFFPIVFFSFSILPPFYSRSLFNKALCKGLESPTLRILNFVPLIFKGLNYKMTRFFSTHF